jgi:pyruvate/2-oxoglutarate dehydrogenase complex dihydrolipoamide acyltransferase (E2) component
MMYLGTSTPFVSFTDFTALTYDHRLVDGREAVTFLKTVKEFIEDPRKMLIG